TRSASALNTISTARRRLPAGEAVCLPATSEETKMSTTRRSFQRGTIAAVALTTVAAAKPTAPLPASANPILARIDRAVVGGGFQMDGYWVWCSSVVKGDDGLYHMFASRWPKRLPF